MSIFRFISIESFSQVGKAGSLFPWWNNGLFTLHYNPQCYLMQKAVFHLFLALNADQARLNSFNGKSIYATIAKDTRERPWAGTKHDSAIVSQASETPRLFQPRATTISLLWSRVSPLPNKAPAAVWKSQAFAHTYGSNQSERKVKATWTSAERKLSSTPKLRSDQLESLHVCGDTCAFQTAEQPQDSAWSIPTETTPFFQFTAEPLQRVLLLKLGSCSNKRQELDCPFFVLFIGLL